MTKFRILLTLSALIFSGTAFALLEKVEEAMELTLSSIALPSHDVGDLTVKACDECATVMLKASAATRYIVRTDAGDQQLSRKDFSAAARRAKRTNKEVFVGVFYRPDSKTLSRVILDAGRSAE